MGWWRSRRQLLKVDSISPCIASNEALTSTTYSKVKSQTRCNIKKDSGFTRADAAGVKYCCIFFARGCCPYGYECNYLHRLPLPGHELPDTSKDCFAREKFSDYRDDMGGVGSFSRQNRTLYVGRIRETGNAGETEMVVRRHFGEFGNIIHGAFAFCAYIQYSVSLMVPPYSQFGYCSIEVSLS